MRIVSRSATDRRYRRARHTTISGATASVRPMAAGVELETTSIAIGGEGVARDSDGRVVFVEGALAGERVMVEITDAKARFARGIVTEVITSASGRVAPRCPEVEAGCGGCDLAHADAETQLAAKRAMVVDAFVRIGRSEAPAIDDGPFLADHGFRTTVRAIVADGRAGLRRRRSHESLAVRSCRVAHPLVEELLVDGRYGDASEVTIRVGARTGERMVIVSPSAHDVRVPHDVLVVGTDELAAGRHAWIHEEIGGTRFRISAGSFFQTRADGADALVDLVRSGIGPNEPRVLVDLCCGVGLFAATVAAGRVIGVESNRSAVADARENLVGPARGGTTSGAVGSGAGGSRARVVHSKFERWSPSRADVVIADPARTGLGKGGVDAVAATATPRLVLVSCDPASLGRDAGLLAAKGYHPTRCTLVDLFPDTSHLEVVTVFDRAGPDQAGSDGAAAG